MTGFLEKLLRAELTEDPDRCACEFSDSFYLKGLHIIDEKLQHCHFCTKCQRDATIQVMGSSQLKGAVEFPPKTSPGWAGLSYRDDGHNGYQLPLPHDPNIHDVF